MFKRSLFIISLILFGFFSISNLSVALAAKPTPPTQCNPGEVKPVNNMVVTTTTLFCPGSYNIDDNEANGVIIVGADNITLDGNNLTLNGKRNRGYGVALNGHSGVTIKNFNVHTYYYGIRADNGSTISIQNNNVSDNKSSDNFFLDINIPWGSAYGGGILLYNITSSNILNNTSQRNDAAIDVYNSSNNTISNNVVSNNKAWGVRLYASSNNTISSNQADHNNRCRNSGCDSAGILLVYGSNGNSILNNDMTYSGDGFFIGNQNGLPSNNNLIEGNNGSFSPHNAFEATFSEGNIFRNNTANNSDYGFWLGFSHDSTLENNTIQNNATDGAHWEHGRYGTIQGNTFANNGRFGLAFALDPNSTLIPQYPGSEASHHHTVSGNTFRDNGHSGLLLLRTTDSNINQNRFEGNLRNLYFDTGSIQNVVNQNNILCDSASKTCAYNAYNNMSVGNNVDMTNNWWGTANEATILAKIFDNTKDSSKGLIQYSPWLNAPAF